MRVLVVLLAISMAAVLLGACGADSTSVPPGTGSETPGPIPVKVVVVTMFDSGEDGASAASEFGFWNERRNLDTVFESGAHHDLHFDSENAVLVMVTGIGTAKSTASVMMLGMDPRFDLSKAYWLVAGIAGVDPEDASIGSAAWAEYLVDGDLAHEIDSREIPDDWDYGYFARYSRKPFDENKPPPTGEIFRTNPALTEWAFQLTKDLKLRDFESMQAKRQLYTDHPNAQRPPFVLKGDQLAAMTFWHGHLMNDWANEWVDYWSDGEGEFVTSAMEDTGTMQSLTWLSNVGRADRERLLVLRTGANYTVPPPGVDAVTNLLGENEGYAGLEAAMESAYIVGSAVVEALLKDWDKYRDRTPTPADIVSP